MSFSPTSVAVAVDIRPVATDIRQLSTIIHGVCSSAYSALHSGEIIDVLSSDVETMLLSAIDLHLEYLGANMQTNLGFDYFLNETMPYLTPYLTYDMTNFATLGSIYSKIVGYIFAQLKPGIDNLTLSGNEVSTVHGVPMGNRMETYMYAIQGEVI